MTLAGRPTATETIRMGPDMAESDATFVGALTAAVGGLAGLILWVGRKLFARYDMLQAEHDGRLDELESLVRDLRAERDELVRENAELRAKHSDPP